MTRANVADFLTKVVTVVQHFNAPHKVQAGWLTGNRVKSIDSSDQQVEYIATQDDLFANLTPQPSSNTPQVIRVLKKNRSGTNLRDYFYISYRQSGDAYPFSFGMPKELQRSVHIHQFLNANTDRFQVLRNRGEKYVEPDGFSVELVGQWTSIAGVKITGAQHTPSEPIDIVTAVPQRIAKVGEQYFTGFSATGGTPPYKFSARTLPAGFTLTTGGLLSAIPQTAGTKTFTILVEDSELQRRFEGFSVEVQ